MYSEDSLWTQCQERSKTEYAVIIAILVVNLSGDTFGRGVLPPFEGTDPYCLSCAPGFVVLHLSFGQHLLERGFLWQFEIFSQISHACIFVVVIRSTCKNPL